MFTFFFRQALENTKSSENNMDIADFQHDTFDVRIEVGCTKKYDLRFGDIFAGCNFMDYGVIWCHKNSSLCTWNLELLVANDKAMSSYVTAISFLDFPISFMNSGVNVTSNQGITVFHIFIIDVVSKVNF